MLKVIINADDFGQSQKTNLLIEDFMDKGLITSTTIMANREDTDEAAAIYQRHKDHVSFGVHLNIDSGRAMAPCQELLDAGFYYKNDAGLMMMNRGGQLLKNQQFMKFHQLAIIDELVAQINYVRSLGIEVSHIDSHHNFHFSIPMLPILRKVMRQTGIDRVRRRPNFNCSKKDKVSSYYWHTALKCHGVKPCITNYFSSLKHYMEYIKSGQNLTQGTLELMVHPGLTKGVYQEENDFLMNMDLSQYQLISYNEL